MPVLLLPATVTVTEQVWSLHRMVSTTVLYGCHAIVSAALAFKAHAVRRAVRQQQTEPLLFQHS